MISLDIKGYCENCPFFKPELRTDVRFLADRAETADHVVVCTRKEACEYAIDHVIGGVTNGKS